jgi:hypothetical protein
MFNGIVPLVGGQIYAYQAGSSTPLATYTSSSGTIANTNPIILGSTGKLPSELWLQSGYAYKFILQDANSVTINTYDNISGIITSIPTTNTTLPAGCILIWSGSTGSIPTGFVLCDGSNATPDLRNSFILGAGNSYTVGQTGGTADAIVVSHTHTATVTDPGHLHNSLSPSTSFWGNNATGTAGGPGGGSYGTSATTASAVTSITVANSTTGTSGTNANLPPYYALAYIMKT